MAPLLKNDINVLNNLSASGATVHEKAGLLHSLGMCLELGEDHPDFKELAYKVHNKALSFINDYFKDIS